VLEKNIASLENGQVGLAYASGLAAMDAVIRLLSPGDEVISTNDLYGGSYRLFTQVFEPFGLRFKFMDLNDLTSLEKSISSKTKMIWIETPTNPMMQVIDIRSVVKIAKKNNILVAVDNTFATPFLQRPLELGADIVIHSATKYLGGHSDVIMGLTVVNHPHIGQKLAYIQNACGAVPGPQDCFLVLRGIKTLHLRMARHCDNAGEIARFLHVHPKISKVYWPGFEDHPGYATAKDQMDGFGGMLSFQLVVDDQESAFEVLKKFRIFTLAESLGGVESLCGHPASMTHAAIPRSERLKVGLSDSLIRLSVGVEDVEDLIEDLDQALKG
jgi:cystathionine beta-lyase